MGRKQKEGAVNDGYAGEEELSETNGLSNKMGEKTKYDPNFSGPIKNRSCTDVICLILFLICFLAMLGLGFYAFAKGNPELLFFPTDSSGNRCGTGKYSDKSHVFFFDITKCTNIAHSVLEGCKTPQICVNKCPSSFWYAGENDVNDSICKDNLKPQSRAQLEVWVKENKCAEYYFPSSPVLDRCLPKIDFDNDSVKNGSVAGGIIKEASETLSHLLNLLSYGEKILKDLKATWWLILISLVIAMILSLVWILVMRFVAGVMVWFSIVAFLGLFGFSTYYGFNKYFKLKDNPEANGDIFTVKLSMDYYTSLYKTWLALGIISAFFFIVLLLVLLFLRQRILIAIALIKEASKSIGAMMFTLLWPLFPFFLFLVLIAFWIYSTLAIASISNNSTNGNSSLDQTREDVSNVLDSALCFSENSSLCTGLQNNEYTIYMQAYMLFMFLWCANFVIAMGQLTLAGAFASYYWTRDKKNDLPMFPVLGSFWRTLRYHMGTAAFGSLIIAIIQMIRIILEYIDHKLGKNKNSVVKFIMCCLKCCFWCLEKFMKFINKNAYIMCAIYGKNFCSSAKKAFVLILRNVVRVVVLDKITDILLFIGRLVVVGTVGLLAYFFFDGRIPIISAYLKGPHVSYIVFPVVIIIIGTYIIAKAFFSVFDMAVDTLFLCFLEDGERNDGSVEKPYYFNKDLQKILNVKQKE